MEIVVRVDSETCAPARGLAPNLSEERKEEGTEGHTPHCLCKCAQGNSEIENTDDRRGGRPSVLQLPRTDPEGSGLPPACHGCERKLRHCPAVCASPSGKQGQKGTERLEDIRGFGVDGDSRGGDVTDNVGQHVELRVVLVDGKAPRVGVAVRGKGDVFADVGDALEGTVWIETKRKVVQ